MAGCILVETLSGLPAYLLQPLIPTLGSFQENSLPCIHVGDSAFIKVLVAIQKSKFSPVQLLLQEELHRTRLVNRLAQRRNNEGSEKI